MHIGGLDFKSACRVLTGRDAPKANMSDGDRAVRAKALSEAKARQRAQEAQEKAYQDDTREAALAIWNASKPIPGTLADSYLIQRGFIGIEEPCFRFHPALPYPGKDKKYPVLVCRVDDMGGELTAIWRIFLRADGRKADVSAPKLGLGPAGGGAVRIGGSGPKVAIAEGVESALGFWCLTGRRYPCLAALSTSGMVGFEAPLEVKTVVIAPDGDAPIRKQGDEYVAAIPAGRKAAQSLQSRLSEEGVACVIAAEPPPRKDFCDLWLDAMRETA